jgi:hypothetical protein
MLPWPNVAPANELVKMATKTPETSVFRKLSKPAAQSFITGFPVVVVLARERRRAVAASATLDTSLPIVVRFFRETPTGEKSEQCALTQTVKAHV